MRARCCFHYSLVAGVRARAWGLGGCVAGEGDARDTGRSGARVRVPPSSSSSKPRFFFLFSYILKSKGRRLVSVFAKARTEFTRRRKRTAFVRGR